MSRSGLLVVLLLVAVVGPIWWFEKEPAITGDGSGLIQPTFNSSIQSPPPMGTQSVYSNAGYATMTSPAEIPNEAGQTFPIDGSQFVQHPGNYLQGLPPQPGSPFSLPTSPTRPPAIQAGWPGSPIQVAFPNANELPGQGETIVFPGDQFGPDLQAGPMEFVPTANLAEIIRFDINPEWVKRRWERVSSSPAGNEYRGLRVPLVTGVNPWDLHGSMTYYFDRNQKLRRIGFQGWSGDSSQLLELLKNRYDFKSPPESWNGVYLAKRKRLFGSSYFGGLILRDPLVIDRQNPTQRVAIMLELNDPEGPLELSPEFNQVLQNTTR